MEPRFKIGDRIILKNDNVIIVSEVKRIKVTVLDVYYFIEGGWLLATHWRQCTKAEESKYFKS